MKKTISLLILASLTLSTFAPVLLAQQSTPKQDDDDVVRISADLIQIDTVVTDKDNNPVNNLTAADFEVLQDGKAQKITSITYVGASASEQPAALQKADKNSPPPPPPSNSSKAGGRVITFVVDDGNCTASALGMMASREALEKFINQQMLPNDLVAIYQTRAGSSVLQQFTSDKAQLLRTARKIRWYPPRGACGGDATGEFYDPARTTGTNKIAGGAESFESAEDRANRAKIDNRAQENQVVGLIGVLRYITRGLQRIGGRKTVFLLSDGLPLLIKDSASGSSAGDILKPGDSMGVMRDLIDSANRASVVFNTIDVRGVTIPGEITAKDDFEGFRGNVHATSGIVASRTNVIFSSQSGLNFLADETGGRFYDDMNDLSLPIRRALNLERGYYLIGYEPDENTFKSKKFNKIDVKVKRPELKVRTRSGFFGITDESLLPKKRTGDSELYEAIAAPLPRAGLDLRVTAFFGNTAAEGNFVRTLLHLNGEQLAFTDEGNGTQKAVFDVVAVTLNEKNEVVDEFNRTHTLRFPAASLAEIKRNGLIYTADVPVKKAGAYNFRVAMRDATSKLLGSAGQQIEVPDLKKSDLFLSGLIIGEITMANGKPVVPSVEKAENGFAPVNTPSIPAVRRFRPGAILGYAYKIYNPKLDKAPPPKLTVQVRLYREGQVISDSDPQPAQIEPQADMGRISDYGYLKLPPNIAAGEYALQIVVRDTQANRTSSQWVDFEVIK